MPKCELCPLRSRDIACIDQITGHGHFCRRLVGMPELARSVVALSEQRAGLTPTPEPSLVTEEPNLATAIATAPDRLNADQVALRLAVCRACPRYIPGSPERCGVLVERGRAGVLMHPKGIPNPDAHCLLGLWPGD